MILIDDRVGSKELMHPSLDRGGIPRELSRLEAGDICFEGNTASGRSLIGVERKCLTDMIASIRRGRFSGLQLPRMQELYEHVWLVVEGRYRPAKDGILEVPCNGGWRPLQLGSSRFMYAELDNALTSFQVMSGVRVKFSYDIYETNRIVLDLYNWYQKDWGKHHAHKAIYEGDQVAIWKPSLLQRVAAQLPGVGIERSGAVASHFHSVKDAVNADERAWRRVAGIGKVTAKRIVEEVGGK